MKKAMIVSLVMIVSLALIIAFGTIKMANASFPVTVIDDFGRTITISDFPERIVCIGPSTTEIAYALGLGDRVVGVDVYSDYPPEAVFKQRISSAWTPDPEEVAALNPDLVFMYSYFGPGDPYIAGIENLGLTVIALCPKTIDDILRNIRLVGNATGKSAEAEALALRISERIDEVKSKTSNVTDKPSVYIEYWYPPPWTFGPETWGHQLIEIAGGINAFGDAATEWVETTDEEVIARNPDVIISLYGPMHHATLEDIRSRPGWEAISAIINGKVFLLDENLVVRPGPRLIQGLEAIAKFLHPNLFGEANVFTFALHATKLKTSVQVLNVTGPVKADITVLKAAANCTLIATISEHGPKPPRNLRLVGNYLEVDCSVPEGLAFILRIYYDEGKLRALNVDEDSLKIFFWNIETNEWVPLNSFVNQKEDYVEAIVTHLSYFSLMGEPQAPLWQMPIPAWMVIIAIVVISGLVGTSVYVACKKRRSAEG